MTDITVEYVLEYDDGMMEYYRADGQLRHIVGQTIILILPLIGVTPITALLMCTLVALGRLVGMCRIV